MLWISFLPWISFLLLHRPAIASDGYHDYDDSDDETTTFDLLRNGDQKEFTIRGITSHEFVGSYDFNLPMDETLGFTIQFYRQDSVYGGSITATRQEDNSTLLLGRHQNGTQICSTVYDRGFKEVALDISHKYYGGKDFRQKIQVYLDNMDMGSLTCEFGMNKTSWSNPEQYKMKRARVTYHTSTRQQATFKVWPPACRTDKIYNYRSEFAEKPTFGSSLPVASGYGSSPTCVYGQLAKGSSYYSSPPYYRCSMGVFYLGYLEEPAICQKWCLRLHTHDLRLISRGNTEYDAWNRKNILTVKSGTTIPLQCDIDKYTDKPSYLKGSKYLYCNINGSFTPSASIGFNDDNTPRCVNGCDGKTLEKDGATLLREGMSMEPSELAPGERATIVCHEDNHQIAGDPFVTCIEEDSFSYRAKPECVEKKGLFSWAPWILITVPIIGLIALFVFFIHKKYKAETEMAEDLYLPAAAESEEDKASTNYAPSAPVMMDSSGAVGDGAEDGATGVKGGVENGATDHPPSYSELMGSV